MTKPIISLPPTKGVVAGSAARIYAAYVSAGLVGEDQEAWIKRSIQEAIAIARAVDSAIQSDNELPVEKPMVIEPHSDEAQQLESDIGGKG